MARGYTVTGRREGGSERQRFDTLADALDGLEQEARAFASTGRRAPAKTLLGTYEPVKLVALRVELSGPRTRAGVDVRGDGSAEAFTGRLQRRLVAQAPGESPYDALRRVLGAAQAS